MNLQDLFTRRIFKSTSIGLERAMRSPEASAKLMAAAEEKRARRRQRNIDLQGGVIR